MHLANWGFYQRLCTGSSSSKEMENEFNTSSGLELQYSLPHLNASYVEVGFQTDQSSSGFFCLEGFVSVPGFGILIVTAASHEIGEYVNVNICVQAQVHGHTQNHTYEALIL